MTNEHFTFSENFPKDYSKFKDRCHDRLSSLEEGLTKLRLKIVDSDRDLSAIIAKIESDKEQLRGLLSDVTLLFQIITEKVRNV